MDTPSLYVSSSALLLSGVATATHTTGDCGDCRWVSLLALLIVGSDARIKGRVTLQVIRTAAGNRVAFATVKRLDRTLTVATDMDRSSNKGGVFAL